MLQYSPDLFQWLLLTSSGPLSLILILVGFALLVWMAATYWKSPDGAEFLKLGLPGVLLLALGLFLPGFANTAPLADNVAKELTSNAKLQDVKLLHLETVSESSFTDGSVSFIGTATDVDGDPRQFRYTQYKSFGIYEMVGFDKPAVDLKDTSFKSVEKGLKVYKDTEEKSDK